MGLARCLVGAEPGPPDPMRFHRVEVERRPVIAGRMEVAVGLLDELHIGMGFEHQPHQRGAAALTAEDQSEVPASGAT